MIDQSKDVRYAGIDISPTMLEEAKRFNAALVAAGRASFHLTSAEHLPFADTSFDRVFAIGVIHFWSDPIIPLVEIRRVMRPGGLAVMGADDPRSRQEFMRPVRYVYATHGPAKQCGEKRLVSCPACPDLVAAVLSPLEPKQTRIRIYELEAAHTSAESRLNRLIFDSVNSKQASDGLPDRAFERYTVKRIIRTVNSASCCVARKSGGRCFNKQALAP